MQTSVTLWCKFRKFSADTGVDSGADFDASVVASALVGFRQVCSFAAGSLQSSAAHASV